MRVLLSICLLAAGFVACSEKKEEKSSPADFEIHVSQEANVEFLRELIDRRPGNVRNYIRLATLYHEEEKIELAVNTLEEALKENPGNSSVRLFLAKYYLEVDQEEKAEEYFQELSEDDESVNYSAVQAELLINKGFYDKALQVLTRSIAKDHGNAELYYLKGLAHEKVSDTVSALNSYRMALNMENVEFSMVVEYLDLLTALGEKDEFYDTYSSLSPALRRQTELKLILAEMLRREQNLDSAKNILYGITDDGFFGAKYLELAELHFDQYRYDSARYYAELSYPYQRDPFAKLMVARSFDKMYNYGEAEETYLEIIELDSTHAIAIEELEKLRRKVRYLRELRRKEEQKSRELAPLKPITPDN